MLQSSRFGESAMDGSASGSQVRDRGGLASRRVSEFRLYRRQRLRGSGRKIGADVLETVRQMARNSVVGRAVEAKPDGAELISMSRVGGLHHRYTWRAAAWRGDMRLVSRRGEADVVVRADTSGNRAVRPS